jgi:ABC-type Fe3+/spermidine/putrescine transport system ATPase subunit
MNSPKKNSGPLFELQNISKTYGTQKALDQVSFSLPKGHWIGILGESGSGKSTLLQIAARYLDSDEGRAYLLNEELPNASSQLLKGHPGIKLVHQEFHLFPNMTVKENISYPIRLETSDHIEKRTVQLITLAGLEEVQDQKAKLLSGGEKQRTAIAVALAELPDLLLLDETFAHLDGLNRSRLTQLFQQLKSTEQQSCIFVTHAPTEAMDWADHLLVLRKGRVIQTGSPIEIYEAPKDEYVAQLTGNINWLSKRKDQFIRPEKVKVSKQKPSGEHVEAIIRHTHFRGIHWEYTCETGQGLHWTVYRLRNDLKAGQTVFLRFSEKDKRAFS